FGVEGDLAGHTGAVDRVVHPVETAQEGRLAAARRPDERGHLVLTHVEIDVEQCLLLAVEDADLGAAHLDLFVGCRAHLASHGLLECVVGHYVHNPLSVYHRRSNRLRSTIAVMFMAMRNNSRMMMAPDVRSTKARSASLAHR